MATSPASQIPPTRAAAVAAELRRLIQSGEISAGQHLRQLDIAQQFGVSTTPVREAFVALAREGLVRQDSHRGVVVFTPSLDELDEIYEIREALEALATELAAKRLTDIDLGALEALIAEMDPAVPERYFQLNREFHTKIYQAAERPRLTAIIDTLRDTAASYIAMTVARYDEQYAAQVHAEHQAILAALQHGTPKQAARAVREHLAHNAAHVRRMLTADGA